MAHYQTILFSISMMPTYVKHIPIVVIKAKTTMIQFKCWLWNINNQWHGRNRFCH